MLETVLQYGTARAAAIGQFAAGKTGTTSNYGDAWFVGWDTKYTVAVWVGYPNKLVPMTTDFNGGPVLGGTFPALIWHDFMISALQIDKARAEHAAAEERRQPASRRGTSTSSRRIRRRLLGRRRRLGAGEQAPASHGPERRRQRRPAARSTERGAANTPPASTRTVRHEAPSRAGTATGSRALPPRRPHRRRPAASAAGSSGGAGLRHDRRRGRPAAGSARSAAGAVGPRPRDVAVARRRRSARAARPPG